MQCNFSTASVFPTPPDSPAQHDAHSIHSYKMNPWMWKSMFFAIQHDKGILSPSTRTQQTPQHWQKKKKKHLGIVTTETHCKHSFGHFHQSSVKCPHDSVGMGADWWLSMGPSDWPHKTPSCSSSFKGGRRLMNLQQHWVNLSCQFQRKSDRKFAKWNMNTDSKHTCKGRRY